MTKCRIADWPVDPAHQPQADATFGAAEQMLKRLQPIKCCGKIPMANTTHLAIWPSRLASVKHPGVGSDSIGCFRDEFISPNGGAKLARRQTDHCPRV